MKESDKPFETGNSHGPEKKDEIEELKRQNAKLITELKGLQHQVLSYEQELESLHSGVVVGGFNPEGKIVLLHLNTAAKNIMEIKGNPVGLPLEKWHEVFHLYQKDGTQIVSEDFSIAKAIRSGQSILPRELLVGTTGKKFVMVKATPLRDESGNVTAAMVEFEDISKEKEIEQELHERDTVLRTMMERIRNIVFLIFQSEPDKIIYASPSTTEILGLTPEDILENPNNWKRNIHADDLERLEQTECMRVDKETVCEYRIIRPNGDIRWCRDEVFPIRNWERDRELKYRIIADISELKRATMTAEEQLERMQREMQLIHHRILVTQVALQIMHDLKSTLTAPELTLQVLARDPSNEKNMKRIETIQRGLRLALHLINSFSPLIRSHNPLTLEVVNPYEIIEGLQPLLDAMTHKNVTYDIHPFTDFIQINSLGLERILLNLVLNATQASEGGGKHILVATRVISVTQSELEEVKSRYPWILAKPGRFFTLIVVDEGKGMPEEIAKKMYNEQITTREQGTGAGSLSIKTALTISKGFPKVNTALGKGTMVEIYLPVVEQSSI